MEQLENVSWRLRANRARRGSLTRVSLAWVVACVLACGCKDDEPPEPGGDDAGRDAAAAAGDAAPEGDASAIADGGDATADASTAEDEPSPDWASIGYDLASTYYNRGETLISKDNVATLVVAWQVDMGGNVYGAPLLVGDNVYASGPATVRAFTAEDGTQLWSSDVTSTSSLAYRDGTLYINDRAGQVVALDAATGERLWAQAPDSQRADGSSSAVVAGDLVLIGGSNGGAELFTGNFSGYLAALDAMTGEVRWNTPTVPSTARGAAIWSTASADLAAGRAFGSTGNNYGPPATDTSDSIIAFDLATGEILWKNQRVENDAFSGLNRSAGPDHDFGANPVLYETLVDGVMTELVSAGAKSGAAHALRRDDGTLVWTRSLCEGNTDGSRGIFVNSAWSGENMLFACNEGGPATLYALDGATGDIAWMRALPGQVWGRMSAANGVGFVGTGTAVEAFDVETGALLATFPSNGGTVASTITVGHGRVAFGEGLSWSSGVRGSMLTVLALP